MLLLLAGREGAVIKLGELVMILELHRQGVSVSAIARQLGIDRKTVRPHIAKGLMAPAYTPRPPRGRLIDPFVPYLRERLVAFPALTGRRLWRELKERGYQGGYTAITDLLRDLRPPRTTGFEVRFETPPGEQAQVDFAQFVVEFTDEPGVKRIVWLFSMVLGYSRLIWARFVFHQDLQTVLRCHIAALEAIGGVPRETPVAHAVGFDTAHPDARRVGHGDVRDDDIFPVADRDLRLLFVGFGGPFVLEPHLVPAAIAVGVIGYPPRRFLRCACVQDLLAD
jgi:transposase